MKRRPARTSAVAIRRHGPRPLLTRGARSAILGGILLVAGAARADAPPDAALTVRSISPLARPHTVALVEAGIIALPDAPISPANRGGKTPFGTVGKGDATVQTGIHLLYRATPDWAFGAVGIFAPNPTTDTRFDDASGLSRTHSRSYLFLGGEGRYFPLRLRWFEAWVGATAGGIVIADRFTTNTGKMVPSFLGTTTGTVSSEGFAAGLQGGADWLITDQWVVGVTLRGDLWFLPSQKAFSDEPSCDPIGDCPTLTGRVTAFEFGLAVGYQIPL